jgi:hypothetical protein
MTNGLSRATSIMYMRRAGLSWETIIKITGHRSAVTLVKSYDLTMEAPGKSLATCRKPSDFNFVQAWRWWRAPSGMDRSRPWATR